MSDFLQDIDKYLDGNMSLEERETFEGKISSDKVLAEELKLQKDMRLIYNNKEWIEGDKEILKKEEAKRLKSFFKSDEAIFLKTSISEVIDENRSNKNDKRFYFIGIAATIAILITISLFVFKDKSYDELYAQYIRVEDIPSLIIRGEENNKLIEKAQLLFENKNYDEAVDLFLKYQNEVESIDPLSYIYSGIAYTELNKFDDAIHQFELLSKSGSLQSKKANWYMAMVFLKQGDKNRLLETLEVIVLHKNNFKYEAAAELLGQIK